MLAGIFVSLVTLCCVFPSGVVTFYVEMNVMRRKQERQKVWESITEEWNFLNFEFNSKPLNYFENLT